MDERIQEGDFDTQAIANVVHALGIMGARSDAVVRYVDNEAERIAAEAAPQAISNISYAFAKLGEKGATRWFEELEREGVVQKLVRKVKLQEISNTIWARATLGLKGTALASAIDTKDVAEHLVRQGKPQCIANTIWATAKMGTEAKILVSAVDRREVVQKLVQEGKPQNISNTIWAMATIGAEARNLART